MKKLLFILSFLFCAIVSFCQYPIPQTIGADSAHLTIKGGATLRPIIFNYPDTSHANLEHISQYPFAVISTPDASLWIRDSTATKWIRVASNQNAITSITSYDSLLIICTGLGACDSIATTVKISSTRVLNDSTIIVCDTANICDTVHIPPQIFNVDQNDLTQVLSGVNEFGGYLLHNTTSDTKYNILTFQGATVYDYPNQFKQTQAFYNSTGIVSFLNGSTNVPLGINYTDSLYPATPTNFTGYMNKQTGYMLMTNGVGKGSFGIGTYNQYAKLSGIFFNTVDSSTNDAITFFAKHPPNPNYQAQIALGQTLEPYRVMTLYDNKNVRLYGYDSSRNDGIVNRALGVDKYGGIIVGTTSGTSSCGLFSGGIVTWDSLLVFDISAASYALCCDNILRTSPFTVDTLPAADSINPVYVAIYLDSTGIHNKRGTPSANPAFPQLTTCQILLTYVLINAGQPQPANINQEVIYDEGTEWDTASTGTTPNFRDTQHPAHLTYDISVGSFTTSTITFTNLSPVNLNNYGVLKFYIWLNSAFSLSNTFVLTWTLGGNPQSVPLTLSNGSFGLNYNTTGAYQILSIPITAFTLIGTSVDGFSINYTGSNSSGFFMDWIQLQSGIGQSSSNGTVTSFSAANLSPLFTTSVATPNTTPALSFNLSNAPSYTVLGNNTNTSAQPSYIQVDLSTAMVTGLLPVANLAPAISSGYYLVTTGGVAQWTPITGPIFDTTHLINWLSTPTLGASDTIGFGNAVPQVAKLRETIYADLNTFSFNIQDTGVTRFSVTPDSMYFNVTTNGAMAGYVPTLVNPATGSWSWQAGGGGSVSANSGLNVNGGVVQLGSAGVNPLLQNTNIDLGGFQYSLSSGTQPRFQLNDNQFVFGDLTDASTTFYISAAISGSYFQIGLDIGQVFLNLNIPANTYAIGAIGGGNNTNISINDATQKTSINTDSLLINSTLSGASSGYVATLVNQATGSMAWEIAKNFATANLTATGDRYHNFKNHGLAIDSIGGLGITSYGNIEFDANGGGSASYWVQNATSYFADYFYNSSRSHEMNFGVDATQDLYYFYLVPDSTEPANGVGQFLVANEVYVGGGSPYYPLILADVYNSKTNIRAYNQNGGDFDSSGLDLTAKVTGGYASFNLYVTQHLVTSPVSIVGTAGAITFTAPNPFLFNGGGVQMNHYGAGAATFDASGNITSVSDIRLKDVEGNYDGGINELMNVIPIVYKWNEKSGMEMKHDYIGFSAQNILASLGENAIGRNSEGYLSIQDRAIMATMVNAIKEQQLEIEQLQREIKQLK